MILYFDTETTGIRPGRIIQLSYIMDHGAFLKCKNFYFAVDYIEPGAQAVHGISVEKLKVLSKGLTFGDHIDEISDDFSAADMLVAHNFKFDLSFMSAEFSYYDRVFRYNAYLDTMRYFTPILKIERASGGYKYPKLTELKDYAEIYDYDVTRFAMKNFDDEAGYFHDARFDTASMYLSCEKLKDENEELYGLLKP